MADPPSILAGVEGSNMYSVYVLRSFKNGKHYVGFTSKEPEERLRQHHSGTSQWSRQNGPLELIYKEAFEDKKSAQRREKFLKSGHGRSYLKKIVSKLA
jgi:putative endonuclease